MKKIYLILLLITTTNSIAINNNSLLKISGKISGKYAIEMRLNVAGDSVHGYYYYTKYKTNIPLIGNINTETSEIILIENPWAENNLNNPTQGFRLNISSNQITGKWFDKSQKEELIVNANLNTEKLTNSTIQGDYESIYNSEKYYAHFEIHHIHDNVFFFNIATATYSGCVGDITGIIKIEQNKGLFSKEGCNEIALEFNNNNLIINENEYTYHGYRCPFDGTYIKQ